MVSRILIYGFVFVAAFAFGQDAMPVKAGDRAPEIDWTRIVHSPEPAKYPPKLAGRYTVLHFLPNITANAQAIGQWNALIAKFTGRPVQFVWIASENWSRVEPFLRDHPINGWLLIDQNDKAALAYGCRRGEDVIVDPSGHIAGFTSFLQPEQLSAILDGKPVVGLDSEPNRFRPPDVLRKPDISPAYEVHISRSETDGTSSSSGPDFWVQRGFDLKAIVAMVYETDPSRVVLPPSLDNDDKFDFVAVLPKPEDKKAVRQLAQRAIEKEFKLSVVVESKLSEVYVLTAPGGGAPRAKTGPEHQGGGSASSSRVQFSLPEGTPHTPEAIENAMREMMKHPEKASMSAISAGNTTMDRFCHDLEMGLGRPVMDETGLKGVYDLNIRGHAGNNGEFIRMLREQTGLVLTPATRSIEILTLRSSN